MTPTSAPVLDRLIMREIPGVSPGLNPIGGRLPPGPSTEVTVWASRQDFRARDQLNIGDGSNFELSDRRFIVRAEGLPAWDVGDKFTSEGEAYTVRGVSQIGRSRFVELLARTTG